MERKDYAMAIIRREIKPVGKCELKFVLNKIAREDHFEIILNHKFSIYKGFKKSFPKATYKDLIVLNGDIQVEKYFVEYGYTNAYKIYISDIILEEEILKKENEWYDSRCSYLRRTKGGIIYDNEI